MATGLFLSNNFMLVTMRSESRLKITIYSYFCSICFYKLRESTLFDVLPKLDCERCCIDFTYFLFDEITYDYFIYAGIFSNPKGKSFILMVNLCALVSERL